MRRRDEGPPVGQANLFDWQPTPAQDAAFRAFDDANPRVWQLFCRFTQDRIRLGFKHYSADAILHRIRWETDTVTTGDEGGFKLNNNWTPFYARKWARTYPAHAEFFRTRRSKADAGRRAA